MKTKEGNPYFIQVHDFYLEVQNYMQEYKKISSITEETKNYKVKIYNLQKQLNDTEYQFNQNEINLKK